MDAQAVSTAIAGKLGSLSLHVYDYGPDAPIANSVYIYPSNGEYGIDFDSHNEATWKVRFLIASTDSAGGQSLLNTLISTSKTGSAVDALRTDKTFGGTCDSSRVTGWSNYGVVTFQDGSRFYSAELTLDILV